MANDAPTAKPVVPSTSNMPTPSLPGDVKRFLLNQLNPTTIGQKNVVCRPGMLIDNPGAVYDRLVANAYSPNKFAGINNYRGIVLLRFKLGLADTSSAAQWLQSFLPGKLSSKAAGESTIFICAIPEMHIMTNPFLFLSSQMEYFERALKYPLFEIMGSTNADPELANAEVGSIVDIQFANPDLSVGYVNRLITPGSLDNFVYNGLDDPNAASVCEAGDLLEDIDAVSFIQDLKSSSHFAGWGDAMLIALAANAHAESRFQVAAAGDPRPTATVPVSGRELEVTNPGNNKKAKYCSFGYWQLNICPETAHGSRFLEMFGIERIADRYFEDKDKAYETLINKDNQFKYVARAVVTDPQFNQHIASEVIDGKNEEETVAFLAGLFAAKFENCETCHEGGRSNTARKQKAIEIYRGLHQADTEEDMGGITFDDPANTSVEPPVSNEFTTEGDAQPAPGSGAYR